MYEKVIASLPVVFVDCPHCNDKITLDGNDFEPSAATGYFAKADATCHWCSKNFLVILGA